MRATSNRRPASVRVAFARRLRAAFLLLIVVSVLSFTFIADRVLRMGARRALVEQAKLCAAALVPGTNGDLADSVTRLRDRDTCVVAVAALDVHKELRTVYPDRPGYRAMARVALEGGDARVALGPDDGDDISVAGIVVPLSGIRSSTARHILVLLRRDRLADGRTNAVLLFSLVLAATAIGCAIGMELWFGRRVVEPLRRMAKTAGETSRGSSRPAELECGNWQETSRLAEQLCKLTNLVADRDARLMRVEEETAAQLSHCRRGFDRRLRRAKDQAGIDPLTTLRNRSYLDDEFESLFSRCIARKQDFAVAMLDIDYFKQYNDTHGHQAGDGVLRFVGSLFHGGVRPTDSAVRYGGDEFLLVFPDTSMEQAHGITERLARLFGQYVQRLEGGRRLSLSAGIASMESGLASSAEQLVAEADDALYAAKRSGKNNIADHCCEQS